MTEYNNNTIDPEGGRGVLYLPVWSAFTANDIIESRKIEIYISTDYNTILYKLIKNNYL